MDKRWNALTSQEMREVFRRLSKGCGIGAYKRASSSKHTYTEDGVTYEVLLHAYKEDDKSDSLVNSYTVASQDYREVKGY